MGKTKDREWIPAYQMERNGFYLLLRVQMEKKGRKNINGVGKEFFAPETYQNGGKILAGLQKRDLVAERNGNVLLREGLEKALEIILDSPHCMNFQNALLHKKEQILTFYYADDAYVGVLLDKKNARVVVSAEEDALYKAFEKQLEDKTVSRDFQSEHWDTLWRGEISSEENGSIQNPFRLARITHCGNRIRRERFHVVMAADRKRIQVIRGADSLSYKLLNRETVPVQDWYGVVCRELERLKTENRSKSGKGHSSDKKADKPKEKSEYEQVIEAPDFPKSGIGYLIWSLKRIFMGLPKALLGMIRRKSPALLLYPLWGALLFLYNMYITCYYNDTFMLYRKARLGNLSPYLMAAMLRTPSNLKGFQVNWGDISTSFLVWPLMMTLTLLLRHLILQIYQKKTGFLSDLLKIPGAVKDCMAQGYGKGKSLWLTLTVVWILGFFIMNPITIFLAAVLLLLMFAQGADNSLVRTVFLWACANGRKKIEAGRKTEPDSRKYRILLFHGSMGLLVYGLVSMLLWLVADYNWWIRLIVTVLMVLFALLQTFMSGAFLKGSRSKTTLLFLLCMTAVCAAAVFGSNMAMVFADDGGWTESGRTLAGLMQNAGFSVILGVSLLTIGLALGLPLVGVAITGLIAGVGTFAVGLTDTKAGDYVKKSARQYFFGTKEGENKTIFCAATELLNFAASFADPAANLTGVAQKIFQGGKFAGDLVSMAGDIAGAAADLQSMIEGSGGGELLWDCLGLGLDFYGMKGDYGDLKKALNTPGIKESEERELLKDMVMDLLGHTYDIQEEGNNLYEFFSTNAFYAKDNEKISDFSASGSVKSREGTGTEIIQGREENQSVSDGRGTAGREDRADTGSDVTAESVEAEEAGTDRKEESVEAGEAGTDRREESVEAEEAGTDRKEESVEAEEADADQEEESVEAGEADGDQEEESVEAEEDDGAAEGTSATETNVLLNRIEALTNEELKHLIEGLIQFLESRMK